jgi:HPt (histidine-containing phosphotransfer) domain-containing protein
MDSTAAKKLPAGLPEVLQAAHQVFINLTTDRILRIEVLAQAVHKGDDAVSALTEIAQIAHKIAGVAGTLGYPEVGDNARALEHKLKADLASGDPLGHWTSTAPDIEALLDDLEALL